VFTDPFSVTYNGSSLSLPRTAVEKDYNRYNTADREFEIIVANNLRRNDGSGIASIKLARRLPDPTPGDAFDAYRDIRNSFGFSFGFDALTRAEASVDIPRLRTALDSLVTSTVLGRIISGEK